MLTVNVVRWTNEWLIEHCKKDCIKFTNNISKTFIRFNDCKAGLKKMNTDNSAMRYIYGFVFKKQRLI